MTATSLVSWRVDEGCLWRTWDAETVVYCTTSGNTYLMTGLVGALLDCLTSQADACTSLGALAELLGSTKGMHCSMDEIQVTLDALEDCGALSSTAA